MSNCFIILAAGKGKRFKSNIPKQFTIYKRKPIYNHTLEKIIKSRLFKYIILVVNNKNFITKKLPKYVKIINGGKMKSFSLAAVLIACGDKSEDSGQSESVSEESE